MRIAVVGLGLIGGSMALALKQKGFATHVTGVEASSRHASRALELGIADEVTDLETAIQASELVMLAAPVDAVAALLPQVMGLVKSQVVMDVGSTKLSITRAVSSLPARGRFVATHPMWGTEFSGPDAATAASFAGRAAVICDREQTDADALALAEQVYGVLGMRLMYMKPAEHDMHVAYVSHISHIASYALALTVLEKEKEEDAIFQLASGGFESTVRLAKSNPDMWVPIFQQNRSYVLDVLNEHIHQLKQIKKLIELEAYDTLHQLIGQANDIRRILK
jgi:prephenate dehydrogenase